MRRLSLALIASLTAVLSGASPSRESQVEFVGSVDRVKDCQLLGSVPGWRNSVKKEGAVNLAEAHGAYSNPLIEIRVLHINGADDEVYACGGAFEDPMKDATNCTWSVPIGAQTPPVRWCGNVSIAKVRTSISGSEMKGALWLRNRSKHGAMFNLKITALSGDQPTGVTHFAHTIGDDTTDTKHFEIEGDKIGSTTTLLISVD